MKLINVASAIIFATVLMFAPLTQSAQAQCPADVNHDFNVDGTDLTAILSTWGTDGGSAGGDINIDGIVNGLDLAFVLSGWGQCPPVVPAWATLLEAEPNPTVVTDANLRAAIVASGFAWRIKDTSSNIEMLFIPLGTFTMGCSAMTQSSCSSYENPTHQVTLTNAFYMGRYEVTQAQWTVKMGSNPSQFQGASYPDAASRPVERVSWSMIASAGGFMSVTGLRLPTEAEWEYAYRANTTTAFHSYPAQPTGFNNGTLLGNIAWFWPENQTHAVGGKLANGLGLHDMSGNVWEWCQDWYGLYSSGSVTNPTGPTTGTFRLNRGGGWKSFDYQCRASGRDSDYPFGDFNDVGFRVVRTP